MSSPTSRKPEFRLVFGYPSITLVEQGRPEPVAEVDLADPALATRLRVLGGTVARARGRLTVVLPESEVWRGAFELRGATPLARRTEARGAAAARMAIPQGDLATVLGPRDAAGRTPVAAVRRSTLAETRAFLRQTGLRPAAIVGAGAFPGFAAPPRLTPPVWRDVTNSVPPRARFAAGAAAVSAAVLALTFLLGAGEAEKPRIAALPASAPPILAELAPPAAVAPEVVAQAEPAAAPVAAIAPPRHAPSPRLAAQATPKAPKPLGPVVTQATRDMPELAGLKPTDDLSAARIAARIAPVAAPPRRPGQAAASAASTEVAIGGRPLARPGRSATATKAPAAEARPTTLRPQARATTAPPAALSAAISGAVTKAAAEPVRLASLATVTDAPMLVTETAAAPQPRPVRAAAPTALPAAAPKPALAAKPAPLAAKPVAMKAKPVAPMPVKIVAAPVAAKPVATRAAAPVRVAPPAAQPVVRQANLAPRKAAPQVQRQALTKPQLVKTATTRPPVEKASLSRGGVSLLGVFGTASERHALLRLPNGKVKRVRAGDNLQGVQVASVGNDSVRLIGGGGDTVLKLAE